MEKHNIVSMQGNIFTHEKEWSTDTYNVDYPKKYAKWKKLDIKGHILYDPIYMKYPEELNL